MEGVFCNNCSKEHDINSRYCQECGNDLEGIIIQHKNKRLPIIFADGGGTERVGPDQVGSSKVDNQSRKDTMHPVKYVLYRIISFSLTIIFAIFGACCEIICCGDDSN